MKSKHPVGMIVRQPEWDQDELGLRAIGVGRHAWSYIIAHVTDAKQQGESNAARLVACWNACEGINPEAVPDLLAAVKKMQIWCQQSGQPSPMVGLEPTLREAWSELRAAIAKAEGGAA